LYFRVDSIRVEDLLCGREGLPVEDSHHQTGEGERGCHHGDQEETVGGYTLGQYS